MAVSGRARPANALRPGSGTSQDRELPRGLRARSVGVSCVRLVQEFLCAGRQYLGIEEDLAATRSAGGAADISKRHARLCQPAGAQVNQYRLLTHATPRFLERLSVRHQREGGAPFGVDRDLHMGIFIERRGLRVAIASDFRHKMYSSTSRTQTPKRGFTCVPEMLTKMDPPIPPLGRGSATTTSALDMCPSTSAAKYLSPLRWTLSGGLERKQVNSSIS